MATTPPCLSCGACCFSQLEAYVRVTGDDYERLGVHAERLTQFIGHRCYMQMDDGHCRALVLGPPVEGDDEGQRRFVCTIYEQRPETCRALARESSQCEAERALKADRPLALGLGKRAPGWP